MPLTNLLSTKHEVHVALWGALLGVNRGMRVQSHKIVKVLIFR